MELENVVREYNAVSPWNAAALSSEADTRIIAISGSFNLASSQALLDMLSRAVDSMKEGGSLSVSLARVVYLPSTAIGALSMALSRAKQRGVSFSVREVPEPIAKIIRLLGFWDYLNIV